jgi:predicted DNA-binding WGR domain protein
MKIDLILVCEDPEFGVRGHRKFWSATYDSTAFHSHHDHRPTVLTRWGRIPDGTEVNIRWLDGQQHKSVPFKDEEAAIKFIDKKATEKSMKGYRVVVHEIDGMNLAQLHCTAADAKGFIKMATRFGYR